MTNPFLLNNMSKHCGGVAVVQLLGRSLRLARLRKIVKPTNNKRSWVARKTYYSSLSRTRTLIKTIRCIRSKSISKTRLISNYQPVTRLPLVARTASKWMEIVVPSSYSSKNRLNFRRLSLAVAPKAPTRPPIHQLSTSATAAGPVNKNDIE